MRKRIVNLATITALAVASLSVLSSPAEASVCTADSAKYVWHDTADQEGWGNGPLGTYYMDANLWGAGGYDYEQTMTVCAPGNWKARVTAGRHSDRAVLAYPNVHRDWHNWSTGHEPRLSSFTLLGASYAMRARSRGIYNEAFDIWLNGVADHDSTEVMIWTKNQRQRPAGEVVASGIRLHGDVWWKLWATKDHRYLAFVPSVARPHGRMPVLRFLRWLRKHDFIAKNSTIGQVGYGVEVVTTNGDPLTFKVNDFVLEWDRR